MRVIPAVDLCAGQAVHAHGGARADYPPLRSELCGGAEAATVVAALLDYYPFRQLYLADLDALQGRAGQADCIAALARRFPEVIFWLDCGNAPLPFGNNLRRVLGSESKLMPEKLSRQERKKAILSLDFRAGRLLGSVAWLARAETWPQEIIVMALHRVGGHRGPDRALLRRLSRRLPANRLYAAGGVRDAADLRSLRQFGIAGALAATTLHRRQVSAAELAELEA